MTDEELERYARHIVLREVGGAGQAKLRAATVALLGAGGIGSPAIQYLAAAGIGRLIIIDDDRVELSNLQRQTIFTTADVGTSKAETAAKAAQAINPGVVIETRAERLDAHNATRLIEGADVVIDGSDSFATRLTLADAALAARIPLVSSAVGQFDGQLAVFRGWESDKPCYRCLVGANPDRAEATCTEAGVLGAMAGVMGSLAALEAIRQIVGFGEDSAGTLLLVDALSLRFRTLKLAKDPACPACAAV